MALTIAAPFDDLEDGESVAVNGVCLTVVEHDAGTFRVDAVVTTRGRTRLGDLASDEPVNLERALRVGDRLGGHFVQGHVDGIGTVTAVAKEQDAVLADISVPPEVAAVTILHGSIAVDGVSLTVNAIPRAGSVQVALIPYTREHTTLGGMAVGARVHLEGDMLGKFVKQNLGLGHE